MSNVLHANQQLNVGDELVSSNGIARLIMQGDGNLVLYPATEGPALWASNTWNQPVVTAIMQYDGNFVCYDAQGKPYWNSVTYENPGAYVILQDDANLVVYSQSNVPLWNSNTAGKVVPPNSPQELLQFVAGMSHVSLLPDKPPQAGTPTASEANGMTITDTPFDTTMSVTDLAGFNPNVGVLWPGALVQGSSLASGVLAPINVERTPLTLLLSTLGIPSSDETTPSTSATVASPSAASVEAARSALVQQGFVVPAKLSQEYKQFFSLDHAMMQIGASASYLGSSIKAQLESDKYSSQSNIMVAITQEYYTIAAESPSSPVSYFGPSLTKAGLLPYANTDSNPITYAQNVTYGRLALLLASSTQTFDSLSRSVNAFVKYVSGSAGAEYGDQEQKILNESDVKLLLLGGSPDGALRLTPNTQEALSVLSSWLQQSITKDPTLIQLGLPISYRLNYLSDNQPAKMSFTTSYHQVVTSPIPQLTSWEIEFDTTDDDKDYDTALKVEVIAGGNVIAHFADIGEKFDNGSKKPKQLTQDRVLYYRDAQNVQLHVRIDPNGNDTWDFGYALTAKNSVGGPNYYKSGHMRLTQDRRDGTQ